jgi:hypothetical protein
MTQQWLARKCHNRPWKRGLSPIRRNRAKCPFLNVTKERSNLEDEGVDASIILKEINEKAFSFCIRTLFFISVIYLTEQMVLRCEACLFRESYKVAILTENVGVRNMMNTSIIL